VRPRSEPRIRLPWYIACPVFVCDPHPEPGGRLEAAELITHRGIKEAARETRRLSSFQGFEYEATKLHGVGTGGWDLPLTVNQVSLG